MCQPFFHVVIGLSSLVYVTTKSREIARGKQAISCVSVSERSVERNPLLYYFDYLFPTLWRTQRGIATWHGRWTREYFKQPYGWHACSYKPKYQAARQINQHSVHFCCGIQPLICRNTKLFFQSTSCFLYWLTSSRAESLYITAHLLAVTFKVGVFPGANGGFSENFHSSSRFLIISPSQPLLACEGVAFWRPPFFWGGGKHGETYSKRKEKNGENTR